MDCHPILAAVSDDDREVVLAVVSKDGERLKCASEALRGDREVVLAAVTHRISDALQADSVTEKLCSQL